LLENLDHAAASQLAEAIMKAKALADRKLAGGEVLWADPTSGSYSFAVHNQLSDAVKNLTCQVVFYDRNGNAIQTGHVRSERTIPAGGVQRVRSTVDSSIHTLTIAGTPPDTIHPTTKVEVRVLDFDIAR